MAGVFGAFLAAGFPTLFLGGASVGAFSILLIAYCILRISFCVSLEMPGHLRLVVVVVEARETVAAASWVGAASKTVAAAAWV